MATYPRSQSRIQEQKGRDAARLAAEILFIAAWAQCVTQQEVKSRAEAEALRKQAERFFVPVLESNLLTFEMLNLVQEGYAALIAWLDKAALSLKPLVRVQTTTRLPCHLLAWQLYGDTARGEELVALNNVATPAFMPTDFLAPSPDLSGHPLPQAGEGNRIMK